MRKKKNILQLIKEQYNVFRVYNDRKKKKILIASARRKRTLFFSPNYTIKSRLFS